MVDFLAKTLMRTDEEKVVDKSLLDVESRHEFLENVAASTQSQAALNSQGRAMNVEMQSTISRAMQMMKGKGKGKAEIQAFMTQLTARAQQDTSNPGMSAQYA